MLLRIPSCLSALCLVVCTQVAFSACLCGGPPCNTVVYGPLWVDSEVEYIACETIIVEPGVTINPLGNLKLKAGLNVVFYDDFASLNNAKLNVLIDGNLACDGDADGDSYNQCMDCDDDNLDIYPGATEICDGLDNDCDEGTADGMGEQQIGQACDGLDLDLCAEGVFVCGGAEGLVCDDTTPDNVEICDDGLDNDCDGVVDNGCPPGASAQIQQVRDASLGPVNITIDGAYVTYLKPAIGAESAGFFIQAEQSGPALFVASDLSVLAPSPAVGDMIGITVGLRDELYGLDTAGDISGYTRTQEGSDIQFLVQDFSSVGSLSANVDSFESEVNTTQIIIAGQFSFAGSGYDQAPIHTAGDPSGNTYIRLATGVLDPLPTVGSCLEVTRTPLWRFYATPQIAAWRAEDIAYCSAP